MVDMLSLLESRTRRALQASAMAHGLVFNTRRPKHEELLKLHSRLVNGSLKWAFDDLTGSERACLLALRAAGGAMGLTEFAFSFGQIRPYRPWDPDSPYQPWKAPVSIAEKLWYLAFIEVLPGENGQPDVVCAPQEVLALLPPLPRPEPVAEPPPQPALSPERLVLDVAVLLGFLSYEDIRPLWERWLPPRALKALNRRLFVREDVGGLRSELQSGRMRFLHYLAEVAGLLGVQAGYLKPTVSAWTWLDASPEERWRALWAAWERDLQERNRLWDVYRFPPVVPRAWSVLIDELTGLPHETACTLPSLADAMRPYLPGDDGLHAAMNDVLKGPLTWAGMVVVDGDTLALTPAGAVCFKGHLGDAFQPAGRAEIRLGDDGIHVALPPVPYARPLVEVLAFAALDTGEGLLIDAAGVARAVGRGLDTRQMVSALAALAGGPLPVEIEAQIDAWARNALRLRLQYATILSSPDTGLLAELRHHRHLRQMFGEALSPHHVTVKPHRVEELVSRLSRRGITVTRAGNGPSNPVSAPDADLTQEMAAYLWLAVRTYRDLSAFAALPVHVPAALMDWLAARLPAERVEALSQMATSLSDDLQRAVDGYAGLPGPVAQDDPNHIRACVEAAYAEHTAITIDYLSLGRGAPARRTIEPVMLSEQEGNTYVEAWCREAEATRTFRLDRILRVVATSS